MKSYHITSLALAALLASCSQIPQEAFFNRGSPESLIDTSSEVVNLSLEDSNSLEELTGWINQEQPTRADLLCNEGEPLCERARGVLQQFNVTFARKASPTGNPAVALHYEHVVARDCENRYINDAVNPYNLAHPTFGCSIAANIVQHVTDKRQFVNPSLLDYPDAEHAVDIYQGYINQPIAARISGSAVSGGSSGASSGSGASR